MSGIEMLLAVAIGYLGGNAIGRYLDGEWIAGTLTLIATVFIFYQTFYA